MPSSHFQKGMLKKVRLCEWRMALCALMAARKHTQKTFLSFVQAKKKVERDKHLAERHRHRNRLEI